MGHSGDGVSSAWEFRRWVVREFGSSENGKFVSLGVQEMQRLRNGELVSLTVRELGSSGDGEFVSFGVQEMERSGGGGS